MDGLFISWKKPKEQMDDLGGFPPIFGNTHILDKKMFKPNSSTGPRIKLKSRIPLVDGGISSVKSVSLGS